MKITPQLVDDVLLVISAFAAAIRQHNGSSSTDTPTPITPIPTPTTDSTGNLT